MPTAQHNADGHFRDRPVCAEGTTGGVLKPCGTRMYRYGQTGPFAHKVGYASVCEAAGGFRFVNGNVGEPPVRPNISMGDTLAGMHAALGVVLALLASERHKSGGQARHARGIARRSKARQGKARTLHGTWDSTHGTATVRQGHGIRLHGTWDNTRRCRWMTSASGGRRGDLRERVQPNGVDCA